MPPKRSGSTAPSNLTNKRTRLDPSTTAYSGRDTPPPTALPPVRSTRSRTAASQASKAQGKRAGSCISLFLTIPLVPPVTAEQDTDNNEEDKEIEELLLPQNVARSLSNKPVTTPKNQSAKKTVIWKTPLEVVNENSNASYDGQLVDINDPGPALADEYLRRRGADTDYVDVPSTVSDDEEFYNQISQTSKKITSAGSRHIVPTPNPTSATATNVRKPANGKSVHKYHTLTKENQRFESF